MSRRRRDPLAVLRYAIDRYAQDVNLGAAKVLLVHNGGRLRPSWIKVQVPESTAANQNGHPDRKKVLLLVEIPREVLDTIDGDLKV